MSEKRVSVLQSHCFFWVLNSQYMTCVLKLKYRSNTRENVNDMYLNDQSLTGYK